MIDIEVKHPTVQFTKDEVQLILGQYNRSLENVQVDIDSIKTWIKTQPHLTHMPEDRLILNLLILNKFSVEKMKSKLDYYYSVKGIIPEMFANYLPSNKEIQKIRKIIRCFVLPKLINLQRIVFYTMDEMHHKFDGYTSLGKIIMDYDVLLYRDISSSFELIIDLSASNFAFWTTYTPTMAKICVGFIEKVLSNRVQIIRFIGLPTIAETLIFYAVSLLPQKIKERVTFHKTSQEMAQFYDPCVLPIEFGGTGRPYRELSAEFDDMVDSCEGYFKQFVGFKVDEKLRPSPLNNDDILGFHGNFRKLEVD